MLQQEVLNLQQMQNVQGFVSWCQVKHSLQSNFFPHHTYDIFRPTVGKKEDSCKSQLTKLASYLQTFSPSQMLFSPCATYP